MANTISAGATTITPTLVLGYQGESEATNTIHPLIGSAEPAVTFAVEALRAGTLDLLFSTESAAWAARAFLQTTNKFTFASTDVPAIGMKFVRTGPMTITLDDETVEVWTLSVGYQEVT